MSERRLRVEWVGLDLAAAIAEREAQRAVFQFFSTDPVETVGAIVTGINTVRANPRRSLQLRSCV